MKIGLLVFLFSFCIFHSGIAQRCPADFLPKQDAKELERIWEKGNQEFRLNSSFDSVSEVLFIPVAVHVLHDENDAKGQRTNISDAQIRSQIRILNEDYRRLEGTPGFNNNPIGADVEIEFCLADLDPDGNPSTGITRDSIGVTDLQYPSDDSYIKSFSNWPSNEYLNIWVIPSLSGNALGYAQFPEDYILSPETDGVVIVHRFFGDIGTASSPNNPYDMGRTTTHEVGHWLGLKHIWNISGCGFPDLPDSIDDTPDAQNPNYGCNKGNISCNSVDLVENYLDYSDDVCMNIFTQGQKTYMRAVMTSGIYPFRTNVLFSPAGCNPLVQPGGGYKILQTTDPRIIQISGFKPLNEFSIQFYNNTGRILGEQTGIAQLDGSVEIKVPSNSAGLYIFRINEAGRASEALKAVLSF